MKRWKYVLIGLPLLALLAFAIWAGKLVSAFREDGGTVGEFVQGMVNPRGLFPGRDRVTLLLLGQDYNHDRKGILYTKGSRADTIMLMSLDLNGKLMSAVSIPRDTKVEAPDGFTGKINGTFARGGVDLMKATLQKEFGITVDYHVVIKPDAVKEIVDSVGGVEVETIDEMHYDDNWGNLHVHLPRGRLFIKGQDAVGYIRFREVNTHKVDERGRLRPVKVVHSKEEGDIRRTARQQILVKALVDRAKNLGNVWSADSIVDTAFKNIDTNLSRSQVLALANIFRGTAGGAMNSATLPGTDQMQGGAYYWVLDRERAQATIDWLINGDEMAGRKMVRITVVNASKVSGLAKEVADFLEAQGYEARSRSLWRDDKKPEATELLYSKAAYEKHAKDIAYLLGLKNVRKDPEAEETTPEVTVWITPEEADSLKKNLGV